MSCKYCTTEPVPGNAFYLIGESYDIDDDSEAYITSDDEGNYELHMDTYKWHVEYIPSLVMPIVYCPWCGEEL